jgi:hypothetical protein
VQAASRRDRAVTQAVDEQVDHASGVIRPVVVAGQPGIDQNTSIGGVGQEGIDNPGRDHSQMTQMP